MNTQKRPVIYLRWLSLGGMLSLVRGFSVVLTSHNERDKRNSKPLKWLFWSAREISSLPRVLSATPWIPRAWIFLNGWRSSGNSTLRPPLAHISRIRQTPPDWVVKFQPIDIVGFILWRILWPRVVFQREIKGWAARNIGGQLSTTKSDGMCEI